MGRPIIDLTGQKIGMLTVLGIDNSIPRTGQDPVWWLCRCECGNVRSFRGGDIKQRLKDGFKNISCGCYIRKRFLTHGKTGTRLYNVWNEIKQRCFNPSCREYRFYGARGITMCDEWREDFVSFERWCLDAGYDETAPRGQFTIDRIDTNGNYEPSNCRLADMRVQANNRRKNRLLTLYGQTKTMSEWSRVTGFSARLIHDRLSAGWNVEKTLTTPKRISKGGTLWSYK